MVLTNKTSFGVMWRMNLKAYLLTLSIEEREALAARCGTSVGHLKNIGYGLKPCAPKLASALERESGGAVTRPELCPNDWRITWPELAETQSV